MTQRHTKPPSLSLPCRPRRFLARFRELMDQSRAHMPNTVPCRRFFPFPVFPTYLSPLPSSSFSLPPNSTHQPAGLSSALALFQMTINPNSQWSRQCNTEYSENNKEEASSKNPAKDFCSGDLNVRVSVCVSGRWLVGPCRTSNRATSFFIRLGHNWRC